MMPTFFGTDMAGGVSSQPVSNGVYTVDTMLNDLSRQLLGHTRRHSRASNSQARPGTAMKISKPGSANNSPRTSTLQSRRRTLIGDGFLQGRLQTRSPAMLDQPYLPTPASEASGDVFHERRETRPARPLSWHPSSQLPQYHRQQPLFPGQQNSSNAMLCPFPAYNDFDMLEALQHAPPTPAAYSGYASPVDAFSPLLLPYSGLGAQTMSSPLQQQQQQQQQQRHGMVFSPAVQNNCPSSLEASYLPPPTSRAVPQEPVTWADYPASGSSTTTTTAALYAQHTAPPTPEDFSCVLAPFARQQQQATQYPTNTSSTQQVQQQQPQQQPPQPPQSTSYQQPLIIRDDDASTEDDEADEGEILYGMGLYDDAPNPNKAAAAELHQSVVLSLLGGTTATRASEEGDRQGGLGLKLEDAWEPPASEDEEEDDDGEGDDDEEDDDNE